MRSIQRGITTTFIIIIILGVSVAVAFVYITSYQFQKQKAAQISSFEECAKLYPVMESYPEQCQTPNGKHFTRELSDEEKQRLVPPQEALQTADETINWKTYTSAEFSFTYPSSWKLKDNFERIGRTKEQEKNEIDIQVLATKNGKVELIRFRGALLDQKSQLEYLHRGMGNRTDQFIDISTKTILFAGYPTIEYIHDDIVQNNTRTKYLIIDKPVGNNKTFSIEMPYDEPVPAEYDQILSTFKFLK